MVRAIIALESRYYRHMCHSRQKRRDTLRNSHALAPSLARSFECVSSKMEIWPSSVVIGFRTGTASQLNLSEAQYLLSVRKTHGFVGSSGAHCERSCTLLPRVVREREMHNSQFARRQARYYFPRIRYTGCFAIECLQEYYC